MPRPSDPQKAVILLSGGLDSTTVLAIATAAGFECYCLSFAYGQRQAVELEKSAENARKYGAKEHLVLKLDLDKIGGSALTADIAVPKHRQLDNGARASGGQIPATYVPGRNSIFLTHAVAWAEVIGASDIFIGVNALDYSGYPDCRPEYIAAFEKLANLGTKAGAAEGRRFTIHAPLLYMSKKEIIEKGMALGVDYGNTHSCYDPDAKGTPCGHCEACLLRLKGFAEAGIQDPVNYNA